MKSYLVGGAVRDALLGQPAGDCDWVVVGADPAHMKSLGFKPVGRDFPVFLHPKTGEEFALARTERKNGHGYRGFIVNADPTVTLEQDLQRRDFTINAIARDQTNGTLIDPYGGVNDLEQRVLRHISPAFAEDPLRVLRAARFMARLAPLGFSIAPETLAMMRQMAANGELNSLIPERIWKELSRSLAYTQPAAFLHTLRTVNALEVVLPELNALYGVPQHADYHPEIDTGLHQELVSDIAAKLAPGDMLIGFAALCHDLGKALTPRATWPHHPMHEQRGMAPTQQLSERLKVPRNYQQLALIACREHLNVHRLSKLHDNTVYELLQRCDAFRRPERIAQLAIVCEADYRGRYGHEDANYPQGQHLCRLHAAALAINARDLNRQDLHGTQIGEALAQARIRAISSAGVYDGGTGTNF
ncbi:multifunctional CCA addition/repair protein [Xylella fastidiosa subsp. sandyi]|uniref:Multifunctional CCA protein n=1 Tax=Xylella fastidiosa subsp. sandyi Ann-1 TaxID=155920 RepID=A0A060H8J0_XYLFS|nr:multifunctional CCA addition/repair protein [Xylella fastidiosa]AIC09691.1 tRNA nucleotidyl transferase [Xylella fastidiosa subsp. sandyi Ann-1]KQH73396.1 2', 3'-cyclic nucleotide 2'-phosphodiesterase [Xylella fastidiosa]RWA45325.1 multifunctional tRNA nucleotidyltransferase/2',3'-cyclic phosphodiesterase/2' nucleotidase/2'phosphatase [Xylella fastidiosa subsp. sandyi]UIX81883.1 multifunctional CCA addition/repair protein [Xylella fastidiosa subsp. sandyi]WNY19649.1 multifunctional CCA addi